MATAPTAAFYVSPQLARGSDFDAIRKAMVKTGPLDVEPKYDGMRAIVDHDIDGRVQITSRNGKLIHTKVPDIVEWVTNNTPRGTILDGEFVAAPTKFVEIGGERVPIIDFNATMRVMGSSSATAIEKQTVTPIHMIVFDMLSYNGTSLAAKVDRYRRSLMESRLPTAREGGLVYMTPRFYNCDIDTIKTVHDKILDAGGEGVIAKYRDALYQQGKRPNFTWYKLKVVKTFDVVVTGFTEANEGKTGKYKGLIGAIKFGAYQPALVTREFATSMELVEIGQCSGMSDSERQVWTALRDYNQEHGILTSYMGAVIEIKANDLVGSGDYLTPRHPQYVRARQDKDASDCLMEQFRNPKTAD